jgi:outer membrane protein assembly factor BamB
MKMLARIGAIALGAIIALPSSQGEDWTQFRGPNGGSVSSSSLPVSWTPSDNLAWKTALPGAGVSSPIVVGGKVIVTCYSGYGLDRQNPGDINKLMRHVVCLDAKTGKQLWKTDVKADPSEDPYTGIGVVAHGYASHTPVTDGKNVYVFFGKSGAFAFDLEGKQLWQTPLGKESDPPRWGSSSSPILYNDLLIVTASAESQSIVGLDTKTGKEVWKQEASGLDFVWGTPVLSKNGGKDELIVCVPRELWGLDPKTGKLMWFSQATEADQASTSPYVHEGVVYAVTGRGGGTVAVRTGGSGDVTASNVVWTGRETARFASPLGYKSKMFLVSGDALTVVDEKSGEKLKQMRLQGGSNRGGGMMGGTDYPSPIIAGDKLYYLKGNGEMYVFDTDGEFSQLSVNLVTSDTESFGGTPAVSDGRMYIRSDKHLYCVAQTKDGVQANASEGLIAKLAEAGGGGGGRGGPGGGGPGGRGQGGPGGPGGGFDPAAAFGRLDADKDGKLTKKELEGNPMADRFAEVDKNKDDNITQEEFQESMRAMMGRGGRGPGGPGGGGRGPGRGEDNRPKRPQRPGGQ